jgi:hypothetical protein
MWQTQTTHGQRQLDPNVTRDQLRVAVIRDASTTDPPALPSGPHCNAVRCGCSATSDAERRTG